MNFRCEKIVGTMCEDQKTCERQSCDPNLAGWSSCSPSFRAFDTDVPASSHHGRHGHTRVWVSLLSPRHYPKVMELPSRLMMFLLSLFYLWQESRLFFFPATGKLFWLVRSILSGLLPSLWASFKPPTQLLLYSTANPPPSAAWVPRSTLGWLCLNCLDRQLSQTPGVGCPRVADLTFLPWFGDSGISDAEIQNQIHCLSSFTTLSPCMLSRCHSPVPESQNYRQDPRFWSSHALPVNCNYPLIALPDSCLTPLPHLQRLQVSFHSMNLTIESVCTVSFRGAL